MIPKPTSCTTCPLYQHQRSGFMPRPTGSLGYGVLLVGEALGAEEEAVGEPFVGKAGFKLRTMLKSRGLDDSRFLIDNVLRCRPPQNQLAGAPYEGAAIAACSPHLDSTIAAAQPKAIVAMGATAMRRLLDLPAGTPLDDRRDPRRGFPEWSSRYRCWIIPTYHPAFLLRGNQHLTGVFLYDVERAIAIAKDGLEQVWPTVAVDPPLAQVREWAAAYQEALRRDPEGVWLAYDIETPHKDEIGDEDDLLFDDPSYNITRIGFSYTGTEGLSIGWDAHYLNAIREILSTPGIKLGHNLRYDRPRLSANGYPVAGANWDTMLAWHVVNSDLKKGLATVASLTLPRQPRWKHLSGERPGFYNGVDACVTRQIAAKVIPDLHAHHLWRVFERHIVRLDEVLEQMSASGIAQDVEQRAAASRLLQTKLAEVQDALTAAVPLEIRGRHPKGGYARKPVKTDGLVEEAFTYTQTFCTVCEAIRPSKKHWSRKDTKKQLAAGIVHDGQPHLGSRQVTETRWVKRLPFSPSNVQMKAYANARRHRLITTRDKQKGTLKTTFNEVAIKQLMAAYRDDRVYPLVLTYREVEKTLGTYVGIVQPDGTFEGGLPLADDGRCHPTFTHNPSTLRLSAQNPNIQQIPRGSDSEYQALVKRFLVADPGCILLEFDYSAIEAVLVGYFARDPDYVRLAKLGVHDFYNAHVLQRAGRITAADLPDLKWSDADLRAAFLDFKARFKEEREKAKRVVHGSNYGMTSPRMFQLYPEVFKDRRDAALMRGLYFEVCPAVPRYQTTIVQRAADDGYLRNPFDYIHRFWNVLHWVRQPDGSWEREWDEGAKSALAFLPQSTAAGIIKEAMLRLAALGYAADGRLRLQVHDSLVFNVNPAARDLTAAEIASIMCAPIPELPLPWQPGAHLSIGIEAKTGTAWGAMSVFPIDIGAAA